MSRFYDLLPRLCSVVFYHVDMGLEGGYVGADLMDELNQSFRIVQVRGQHDQSLLLNGSFHESM